MTKDSTPQTEITPTQAQAAAEVLKALGHPLRLRIVSALSGGELHVSALAERLEAPQAVVSQQLKTLRAAGLVDSQTVDGRAYYRIVEPHLYSMLQCMGNCLVSRGL